MSPTGMMRLPADRLECPLVEPSQQLWPHWSLVVLHQAAREVVYSGLEVQRKCGCSGGASSAPSVAYTPIESPSRALTSNKRVCFVRHGQGAHNRTVANWGMVDPELTSDGEAQVADLHERLKPFIPEVELIVTSPLTRAMQTATGGFAGSKAPYVMLPMLRERLGAPCDTGRTKSELLRCFPQIASWEVRGAARTWHTACAHVSRRARFVWNPYPIIHAHRQAHSPPPPPPPPRLHLPSVCLPVCALRASTTCRRCGGRRPLSMISSTEWTSLRSGSPPGLSRTSLSSVTEGSSRASSATISKTAASSGSSGGRLPPTPYERCCGRAFGRV